MKQVRLAQMVRATGLVMAAFVLSRLLGLVREMVIARQFGTSLELAAYLAAFRVPDFIFYLIAGGALGSAFIPTFTEYLATDRRVEAWRMASALINLLGLILTLIALLAGVFAPFITPWLVPGFDAATQALTARLMRVMLMAPVIFGISGLLMGILHAHQHFLAPALAPVCYNLAIIVAAWVWGPRWGVHALAFGVVAGAVLHLLIQLPALRHRGGHYTLRLGLRDPGVRQVGRLMAPRVLGLAAVQLNFVVNTILASRLGPEALPALSYAWLLMMLPQGVFAMALATVAFPTFAELAARQDVAGLRNMVSATLRTVLFLTVPASLGLFLLRVPLVEVLLQRGAFTAASTQAVTFALQFYAFGLFAHAAVEILARAFYALHDTRMPVMISLLTMGLNIALSLLLIRRLSFGGLALANTLATLMEMGILLWVMHRRLHGLEPGRLLRSTLRIVLAAAVMGLALSLFTGRMSALNPLLVTVAGISGGAVLYLATSVLIGSDEIAAVLRLAPLPGPNKRPFAG